MPTIPDEYNKWSYMWAGPADNAVAITPNDGTDLAVVTRGIYVGGAGNIKLTTVGGQTVTFAGLTAGSILPIRASRVFLTDTTATNLISLY